MDTRSDLSPMPPQIAALPVDPERGYPVPWFVKWIDGKPEFRAADGEKWSLAVRRSLCWVCGERLGSYKVFVLGPMCGITRSTREPPCHLECARWSAINCPFLNKPQMTRRDHDGFQQQLDVSNVGMPILRNPGVTLLWITHTFKVFRADWPNPGWMISVGPPERLEWWREKRRATRAEIEESIRTGYPLLEEVAREDRGGSLEALQQEWKRLQDDIDKEYPRA